MTADSKKKLQQTGRQVTENLLLSLFVNAWPSVRGVEYFGIESDRHYRALQYAVKMHRVRLKELEQALGDGEAITALIRPGNPYYGVTFKTPWDVLGRNITDWADPGPGKYPLGRILASEEAINLLSRDEIKGALRRHAAGDWGEGDWWANEVMLKDGGPVISVYRNGEGAPFWVVTEADGPSITVTTVLRPLA
jgi:hypothetical protein